MRWLARGEPHLPAGTQWLTAAEAQRAAGMRFTKRRTEYLVRRLAAKTAVATALGLGTDPVDLGRVAVLNRRTGAPYVLVDDEPLGLDVSLTDRAGWGVCLVGPDLGAVGCDVEIAEPRSAGFVADFLTPHEQALVRAAADPQDGHLLANLVWSAKESALKVLRTGLRRDTRTVEVHLDPTVAPSPDGWAALQVRTDDRGVLPGWWHRAGPWLLTVAYAAPGPAPQPLEQPSALRSATPTHSWLTRPLVQSENAAMPRSSASTT
jgi:4'-phosphopantetheinyl transferase